jgi:hypothetical protein
MAAGETANIPAIALVDAQAGPLAAVAKVWESADRERRTVLVP